MVNVKWASEKIGELALMKFFPDSDVAQAALVRVICQMSEKDEQIAWLVDRALTLYDEWPGPKEIRALFCSRWTPRDGAIAYSDRYPVGINSGGFPKDPSPRSLPAPPPKQIKEAPMCEASRAVISDLAEKMPKMPKARYVGGLFADRLQEILTPPADRPAQLPPAPQIITQADVEREQQKRHGEMT